MSICRLLEVVVLGLYMNGRLNGWLSGRLIGGDEFRGEEYLSGGVFVGGV